MFDQSSIYAAQVAPSLTEHYDAIMPMFTAVCTAFIAVCTWILLGMKSDIKELYKRSDDQACKVSRLEGEHAARTSMHVECGERAHD